MRETWNVGTGNLHILDGLFRPTFTAYAVMVCLPYGGDEIRWRSITPGCGDGANDDAVVLVEVVRAAIAEVHAPREVAVVLRGRPMVTTVFRLCILVTEGREHPRGRTVRRTASRS